MLESYCLGVLRVFFKRKVLNVFLGAKGQKVEKTIKFYNILPIEKPDSKSRYFAEKFFVWDRQINLKEEFISYYAVRIPEFKYPENFKLRTLLTLCVFI